MSRCPIAFDPLAPEQLENPYPIYARARSEEPIFHVPAFDLWVVTRYDDVLAVLKDHEAFSSEHAVTTATQARPAPVVEELAKGFPPTPTLTESDSPLHDRLRGLVNKAFTARRVAAMEGRIAEIATGLIDDFAPEGRADVIERFAWPLPLSVIGDMLGVPVADLPVLHDWCHDWLLLLQAAGTVEDQVGYARSVVALQRYFTQALEERQREPTDDLMSALLEARLDGETPLSMIEAVRVPLNLIIAGHVTVTRAIGSGLLLLLDQPRELELLRASPERIPDAVEEILRMESPAQGLFRTATRDVKVGQVSLPKGARLMVHYASANRDERQFSEAERFVLGRPEIAKHVAFGKGIHFCLGAPLARLELRIALALILERLPNFRLWGEQPIEREQIFFARGLSKLQLEWDAA